MTIVICIIIIDEKIKEKLLSAQLSECQLGTGLFVEYTIHEDLGGGEYEEPADDVTLLNTELTASQ